jgi:hypothetical protein
LRAPSGALPDLPPLLLVLLVLVVSAAVVVVMVVAAIGSVAKTGGTASECAPKNFRSTASVALPLGDRDESERPP